MKRKSMFTSAVLLAFAGVSQAHEFDPPVEATPALAAVRYCLTVGVRAAWGAQARFHGAPATFKYIPAAPLKKMFWADGADIPHDAIYVLDELDLEQRRLYEESAFYGWKQADRWVQEGRAPQEYEVLSAIFFNGCQKELTAQTHADAEAVAAPAATQ